MLLQTLLLICTALHVSTAKTPLSRIVDADHLSKVRYLSNGTRLIPLSLHLSMRSTRTLFLITGKQGKQKTLPFSRYTSFAKNSTTLTPKVLQLFTVNSLEIILSVDYPIHEHIRIDENSKVAFVENSERTLCTLSHLNWQQVGEIMLAGGVDVFHYPHFMKLHPSLITYLRNELSGPSVWSSTLRRHKSMLVESLRERQYNRAEGYSLSICLSPLVVADEPSLRATVQDMLHGFSLREHPYSRSHSPAWEKTLSGIYEEDDALSCTLPSSVELSFSSHGVDLADLRGISTKCLVHLIHHAAENPSVISVAIHPRPTLMNYEARGLTQSGHIFVEPYREAGLTGAGQVCGVGDSGVNDISCFFLDDSKAYPTVTASRNGELQPLRRKIIQYVAYADGSEDEAGHGTHVCGSIGTY